LTKKNRINCFKPFFRDFKITIPITGIIKFFKNRGKPSTEEKIKREMDKIKRYTFYNAKCCNALSTEKNLEKDGVCTICGRSFRGYKEREA